MTALGGGALAASAGTPALAQDVDGYPRIDYGLVLSGGGAKGAYEAGIIDTLARGIPDGSPMRPYGGVAGTSIGALNGWFVATGQYSNMRQLWMSVASDRVFRLKPEFAKLQDPQAGVLDRLFQAIQLGAGIRRNVQGLCQTEPALSWIQRYVDPSRPTLLPFAWAVTNLTRQTSEYFYRLPPSIPKGVRDAVLRAFQQTLEPGTVVREANDEILHRALFASACLPIVFDPIDLPAPDGDGTNQYCDGGVAANTPLTFGRTVAHNVHVVILTPPPKPQSYPDALSIGWAAYDTMQNHIILSAIRSTYFETHIKRQLEGNRQAEKAIRYIADADVSFLRPLEPLPVETTTFDDGERIANAYAMGMRDGGRGFRPYRGGPLV
ncbi:MAG TPA: patatin-like phospholipase family protein [Candidatus Baltobacteraceae bacterium]